MKKKIERFANGIFDYELPLICLSEEKLRITVEADKVYEGSFTIRNREKTPMSGVLYSSSRLLTIGEPAFKGVENKVSYRFDAAYLKIGDTIQGEITIASDCGERILPFSVQIEAPYYMSSLGKIKDLFHFANLARGNWNEAKKVFYSGNFEHIFLHKEEKYKIIYRHLLESSATNQALEEFLIAIHKKSSIHLSVDRTKIEYQISEESFGDSFLLTKNHWGYCEVKISTDVPFIEIEQKISWEDFFLGNTQKIPFVINPKNMRYGNNYGRIWIKTVHQTLTVDVICRYPQEDREGLSDLRKKQRIEFAMVKNYLSLRLDRIKLSKYLSANKELLDILPTQEESRIKEIYGTHMEIISGKNQKAEENLNKFAKEEALLKEQSCLVYSAYLYLKALYYNTDETIADAAETIRKYYENACYDWKLLWFLLFTDKRYENNKRLILTDIKEQYDAGCHSPILYYEAVCALNEEPSLLHELGSFEIQVMNFGIKNCDLNKELVQQYTYLANKSKKFHPVVFQGLIKLYHIYNTKEILSAICSMLIKSCRKSSKYFEWYRLGVEAQLRITELYEYYMNTIDEKTEELLPQSVLRYFVYNNSLNDKRLAFLYANIIKNKHQNESIYHSYHKKMEVFADKQMEAHHVSHDLAVLYREYMEKENPNTKYANHLPHVIYRQELECNNPNMVSVIVVHKELDAEEAQPLFNGKAQIDIYTKNAEIFLVDAQGNRYVVSEKYTLHPLMASKYYEAQCIEYSSHPKLLLHFYDRYQSYRIENEQAVSLRKKVLSIEGLKDRYYYECIQALIDYYYDKYCDDLMEYYLRLVDLHQIHSSDRVKLIGYLVKCGLYYRAVEAIETFGYEEQDTSCLVKLCAGWLTATRSEKVNNFMIGLSFYVFSKGKYDETILKYLTKHYYGPTQDMHRLWKAAKGFELETHDLEERLLVQMLFGESYIENCFELFYGYYKDIADKLLVRAYLTYYAYKYMVHGRVINKEMFPIMRRELNYEENDICLLAWLKFRAVGSTLEEEEIPFIECHMQRLLKKGIILPYFRDFEKWMKLPDSIVNKIYVEYTTDPKRQIYIHYRLSKENESEEFITERLANVFMGVHSRGFVLFYHEEMQYYITEEYQGEVVITESATLCHDRETPEEDSKYNLINLMLMSKEMKDDQTLLELMDHYVMKECMITKCFQLVE